MGLGSIKTWFLSVANYGSGVVEVVGKRAGLLCERIGVRYQMIDTERKAYPISLLCRLLQVSRTGYYSWRTRGKSARQKEYEFMLPVVQRAHEISKATYGARRISEEVEAHGKPCDRVNAKTLMGLAGVSAKQKRKFKINTDSKHNLPVA